MNSEISGLLPEGRFGSRLRLALPIFWLFAIPSFGAHAERIVGPIENHRTTALKGNVRREAVPENDRGPVEPGTLVRSIRMVLSPSAEQSAELERFLEEQRDPASVDYRNWLTPEQFGERFGLAPGDIGKLTAWLESQGFTIEQVARAGNWITFHGTAAQVGLAFHTELRRYEVDGEAHFANATVPSMPRALAGVVSELRGLDDFRPKPMRNRILRPSFASGGNHYLGPNDFATIYNISPLYAAGFDGLGQKIAIPGQTDISLADLRGFRSYFSLPSRDPQMVLVGSDPGVSQNDEVESLLDIEWSGAVARNATIVYVYSQNAFDSVQYAIDQNVAPVISLSYGGCEIGVPASYRSMAQQANAQGITWMNAAGDSGAAGCDPQGASAATHGPAVIFPADLPEVTAVGGTTFNEGSGSYWNAQTGAALSYIPETAWNDTAAAHGIEAGGGGASVLFAKPWWQTGPGVPGDGARDLPDVALSSSGAHDGYVIYAGGSLMSVGGTSAASPSFAGIVSLLNQYLVVKGMVAKPGLGNINPALYSLAQKTSGVFHDITAGSNIVPCAAATPGCTAGTFGYKAGPGYDLVTGLGSVDAFNLVTKWATGQAGIGTTMTLSASPSSIAKNTTTQLTAKITPVTGSSVPTGNVAFTSGTVSLGSAGVTASGTASLTVAGSNLLTGSNPITASYTASGNFANATASATVVVTAQPGIATTITVTANPASIPGSGTTQLTATVKPASGTTAPTGSVTFATGNVSLGSATVSAAGSTASATISLKGSSLTVGGNAITATYIASGSFSNSSAATVVTVTAPAMATTTSLTATPASLAVSGTTLLIADVKPGSGTAAATGSVTFTAGNVTLGTSNVAASTASLTIKGASLAAGPNTITAAFVPSGNFAASTGTTIVTVAPTAIATTTTVTASLATVVPAGTTLLSAVVKAASGSTMPTGSISFASGNTILGSVPLTASGASLMVKGSSLAPGNNRIVASYAATGNFANSSASVDVVLTGPASVVTAITVTASPATIAPTDSTILSVTVKPGSGTASPAGNVAFWLGNTSLGVAPLAASGGTASFPVKGSSLSPGANVVTVSYPGNGTFAGSSASTTVTVTGPGGAAKVAMTVTPNSSMQQPGWNITIQLQEQAGIAATVMGFSINGTDFSSVIGNAFGSKQLPAHGTLIANLAIQWKPLPANMVFAFTGTDAGGQKWSQILNVATASK